jgi:short subunit dehydrogenase-like uncharacterized protein
MTSPTPRDQKPYDVIVLGATGYVGQLIAEYLATSYCGNEVRWAMAGRSQKKLDAVKASLGAAGAEIATLVADTSDMNALEALVDQGRVILTTVGPYAKYGSALVRPARVRAPTMST